MQRTLTTIFVVITAIVFPFCTWGETALEPFTYHEDFETREVSAWASYPLWQDTAYDDNFRVDTIVPGDTNISLEQMVTPYSHNDVYAGAQKVLDMYLVPDGEIALRYYIKTHLPVDWLKVRFALGDDGAVEYTVNGPGTNGWRNLSFSLADIARQNPQLANRKHLHIYGMACLVKIADADPDMPVYFGLDDVTVTGMSEAQFAFTEPVMYKLAEWKEFIPERHYLKGERFIITGTWQCDADRVAMTLSPFTKRDTTVLSKTLGKSDGGWSMGAVKLDVDEGMYYGLLRAYDGDYVIATTPFTVYVAPEKPEGRHPRLWYGNAGLEKARDRMMSDDFAEVRETLLDDARAWRERKPLDKMVYDFDQFPEEDWLVTRYSWSRERITHVGEAVRWNALAWSLLDDREAGKYVRDVLVRYAGFPGWLHPWMAKRGRHTYLLMGDMGMDFALGYDLAYDLMTEEDRALVRTAFRKFVIEATHRGYVKANLVTNHTSNWLAAIMGASVMCQAAIYGDGDEYRDMEPYFTGAVLKENAFIRNSTGDDGGYGEGYNYYHYTSRSLSKSLPALDNVFRIDLSARLDGLYEELLYAGNPLKKEIYYFGDSRGKWQPMEAWAWLLPRYRDPLLGWMYHFSNTENGRYVDTKSASGFDTFSKSGVSLFTITQGRSVMDAIYDTDDVPVEAPFGREPVRLFRDIGTTVFKSGWEADDFTFVMRTGPFFNHQHLDQGTFWLADRGNAIIHERQGSAYYDDPLYESYYTQPIAHSTILIDHNGQCQRTGDPRRFIDGFDDHAFVSHFLDGTNAAFVQGDIGRVYRGSIDGIQRNVLYLKPRTLLMLDTITPGDEDVDVSLLYQGTYLDDITARQDESTISVNGTTLHIRHLAPETAHAEARMMPHFLREFEEMPLRKKGYLEVTARTAGKPLVMANILGTGDGTALSVTTEKYDGYVTGTAEGHEFAFSTTSGTVFDTGAITTDACAVTWRDDRVFAALCTSLYHDGNLIMETELPVTCEVDNDGIRYYLPEKTRAVIGVPDKPSLVTVNGTSHTYMYEPSAKAVILTLEKGNGTIRFE